MIDIFIEPTTEFDYAKKKEKKGLRAWCDVPKPFLAEDGGNRLFVKNGPSFIFPLCRELVAIGVPDQPWRSFWKPKTPSMSGPSIFRSALTTIKEDDVTGARFVKWGATPFAASNPVSCGRCGNGKTIYKMICLTCLANNTPDSVSQVRFSSGQRVRRVFHADAAE